MGRRNNTRKYTEPIYVFQLKQVWVDGMKEIERAPESKQIWGNVFLNRNLIIDGSTKNFVEKDGIKIEIQNDEAVITPEITLVEVRGKEYIVTEIEEFGGTDSSFKFIAVGVK